MFIVSFVQWMFVLFVLLAAVFAGYTTVVWLGKRGVALPARVLVPLLVIVAPFSFGLRSAHIQFGVNTVSSGGAVAGYILAGAIFFCGVALILLAWLVYYRSVRER